MYNLHTQTKIT